MSVAALAMASVLGFIATSVFVVVRALAVDELKGRVQRRVTASVEATIASLPSQLQDEWAEEWRSDLAVVISMPLTAIVFARGVRLSAIQFVADPVLAPAAARRESPAQSTALLRSLAPRQRSAASAPGRVAAIVRRVSSPAAAATGSGILATPAVVASVDAVGFGALAPIVFLAAAGAATRRGTTAVVAGATGAASAAALLVGFETVVPASDVADFVRAFTIGVVAVAAVFAFFQARTRQ